MPLLSFIIALSLAFGGPASAAASDCGPERVLRNLGELRAQYATFDAIGKEDNARFIALADRANEGQPTPARLFVDSENSFLKDLNDVVIGDKPIATAVTHLHKTFLWEEIQKNPELRAALVSKYSDFKSVRLAFSRDDEGFQSLLQQVNHRVAQRVETQLAQIAAREGWDLTRVGGRVGNWHLAGAENGRNVRAGLEQSLGRIDRVQGAVQANFQAIDGMMVEDAAGKWVLSAEAIDTIRKATPKGSESPMDAVRRAIFERFDFEPTKDQLLMLKDYLDRAISFSPGIYQEERIMIDLGEASHGFISADFKGQNARNIEATLRALSRTQGASFETRVRAIRAGEREATRWLEKAQEIFETAVSDSMRVIRGAQFSGDDGIAIPAQELNRAQKRDS
jgi:hypothetical protein